MITCDLPSQSRRFLLFVHGTCLANYHHSGIQPCIDLFVPLLPQLAGPIVVLTTPGSLVLALAMIAVHRLILVEALAPSINFIFASVMLVRVRLALSGRTTALLFAALV